MLSREELSAWIRLVETPSVGAVTCRRLLAAFGSPEGVLGASEGALRDVVGAATAGALLARDARLDALCDTTWRWLHDAAPGQPRDLVALGDLRYPSLLLETTDPPPLLYTLGDVALLQADSIAVVGSRSATPQGVDNARLFSRHLSEQGWTIVSGLALGIDGAAHEGGLAARGRTVAFVGTGLDQVYPRRHEALARRIAEGGLVASDQPLGMGPLAANFPRRNRLIAGVARGTLVVEAALQSGSLITARLALEAGREVFAIPGSIHSPQARGCHRLIQQGAKLVETGDDILQELRPGGAGPLAARHAAVQPSLFAALGAGGHADEDAAPGDALLAALGHDPSTFDTLAARSGLPADRLAARLLELELAGQVQRLPGGLYQRRRST